MSNIVFTRVVVMLRILFILSVLLLSGCQSINNRGEFVSQEKIEAIEKNHISKEQVVEMLGEPTIIPDYTLNTWYYIGRKVQDKVWSNPKVRTQRIIKITFAGNNVEKVEINNKRPRETISVQRDSTEVKGTEESMLQTFVKNFGRFNKSGRKSRR